MLCFKIIEIIQNISIELNILKNTITYHMIKIVKNMLKNNSLKVFIEIIIFMNYTIMWIFIIFIILEMFTLESFKFMLDIC